MKTTDPVWIKILNDEDACTGALLIAIGGVVAAVIWAAIDILK